MRDRFSDCGQYRIIQVNQAYEQLVPLAQPSALPTAPTTEGSAPPEPRNFAGMAIGLIATALVIAVLSGGAGESDELVELRRENQYLRGRVDQLEYQLLGIYSAQ